MLLNKKIQNQVWALFFISIGGWLFHLKIHPVSFENQNPANFVPFAFGLLNVFIVPFLFNYKKTSILAYLINGFGVIIGVITMFHTSLSSLPETITLNFIFLRSLLPYIFILFSKLFIGQTIFRHYYAAGLGRLFTPFWWAKHFAYLSIVYYLGHTFWK